MQLTYNTLVISDLHLGEDLSPSATLANRLHLDLVERQLCSFLRHYGRRRDGGRPWRLVVNGDLIDFLSICVKPGDPDYPAGSAVAERADRDEREFGLRRTPEIAAIGVHRVAERHREVFRGLARFVAGGHRLDIVTGNHDAELGWPEAQRAFTDEILAAYRTLPEAGRAGATAVDDLVARIAFHPWFFYEPNALWIEHGHQYDECCSFENQLDPREPTSGAIVMNVDGAGARYLTNCMREATPHEQDSWSAIGYIRLGFSAGWRKSIELFRCYHLFAVMLLAMWKKTRNSKAEVAEVKLGHIERRREIAARQELDPALLARLDELRRPPVVGTFARLAPVVMIDRLMAFGGAALLALIGFPFLGLPWGAVLALVLLGVAHAITSWTAKKRQVEPSAELAAAGARVAQTVDDVRYVVFGHSHDPVVKPLHGGATYVNLGTWVPAGQPGILRAFTHLVVRHTASGPVAALCQWRDGQSRAFTPGWRPKAVPQLVAQPVAVPARETATAPARAG
jgi:UDP-2,3-diacylglucosamine pyrophosphatase LpxH